MAVKRIFVEKKRGYDIEAQSALEDFRETLGIRSLQGVRLLNRYDVEGMGRGGF